jgi:hypothetical protein
MVDRRSPGDEGRRYNVNWDLTAGHHDGSIRGQVTNVSATGVLIRVPAPYGINNLVEIEMSPSVGVFIKVMVQIVREHGRTTDDFYYGALILKHNEETHATFLDALLKLRREEMRSDFGRGTPLQRAPRKPPR